MAQTGLLDWANSVRLTMATDPGRQLFQEQVHTHGFLFLEDYLGNIISGARQDPLIELVKTPGRKKAIAMKSKLTSKLASVVTLSLEDDAVDDGPASAQSFHEALLDARLLPQESKPNMPRVVKSTHYESGLVSDSSIPYQRNDDTGRNTCSTSSGELTSTAHLEQKELSIIAEDDETIERTRTSIQISHISPSQAPMGEGTAPPTATDNKTTEDIAISLPGTLIHTPLSVKTSVGSDIRANETELPLPRRRSSLVEAQSTSSHMILESPIITNTSPNLDSAQSDIVGDIDVPIRDPDADSELSHKSTIPLIPSLPEPMPLRKSMKSLRDYSAGVPTVFGTTTPGTTLTGKRTSWLMKAREAKASEGTSKKSGTSGHFTSTVSYTPGTKSQGSLKRKSGEMTYVSGGCLDDEERKHKAIKTTDANTLAFKAQISNLEQTRSAESMAVSEESSAPMHSDMERGSDLDRLKKTVEDLTRQGKTTGKSFDSNAVNALAEARAAAEARIAERQQKEEEITLGFGAPAFQKVDALRNAEENSKNIVLSDSSGTHARLSISDLFPADSKMKEKHKAPEKIKSSFSLQTHQAPTGRESVSTTPPHSPPLQPSNLILPSGPVFNKPPPVFVAPVASHSNPTGGNKDTITRFHPSGPFSKPISMTIGIEPRLPSPKNTEASAPIPLTAHSTLESMKSDNIFDDDSYHPAWMPNTQDTEYSTVYDSQKHASRSMHMNDGDDDDNWAMDDNEEGAVHWTSGAPLSGDESFTWSTVPSQNQAVDTGTLAKELIRSTHNLPANSQEQNLPGALQRENDKANDHEEELGGAELEESMLGADTTTVKLVETQIARSASVMSTASSSSSQSQGGFFSQATKLFSSALGTSKKSKPEVKKVLQMAAVAAKKQQEEADKKAARLKEMENRRLAALQRKAEEEKARAHEQERKLKEEGERRKRERDDTDKRPLKAKVARKDEDTTKKRKMELEKKPEPKKPMPTPNTKAAVPKSTQKPPPALASSAAYNASSQGDPFISNLKGPEASKLPKIVPTSAQKPKVKLSANKPTVPDDDDSQPSQVLKTQMSARAKAQLQAAKHPSQPIIPSESIELPDINSEYSDSEDEDRPKTFDPPDWAQSPELRQALQIQSTINPDDIFGTVRPLRMEEIFKTRTSRFRARTSSANWTGSDRLTQEEEKEYARRMGFR